MLTEPGPSILSATKLQSTVTTLSEIVTPSTYLIISTFNFITPAPCLKPFYNTLRIYNLDIKKLHSALAWNCPQNQSPFSNIISPFPFGFLLWTSTSPVYCNISSPFVQVFNKECGSIGLVPDLTGK